METSTKFIEFPYCIGITTLHYTAGRKFFAKLFFKKALIASLSPIKVKQKSASCFTACDIKGNAIDIAGFFACHESDSGCDL